MNKTETAAIIMIVDDNPHLHTIREVTDLALWHGECTFTEYFKSELEARRRPE